MPYIVGAQKYLAMADEPSWGTTPSPFTYIQFPVQNYTVRSHPNKRNANMFDGLFSRRHGKIMQARPAGQLVTSLFGWRPAGLSESLAEYLMTWAFNYEDQILPSKLVEWYEGPNLANKRHTGLQVNRASLRGSEGAQVLTLTLDVMGQFERGQSVVGAAQALPDDRNAEVEFQFSDVTFALAGSNLNIGAFSLDLNNGLVSRFQNSFNPTIQVKTRRDVNLTITPLKTDDTYDLLRNTAAMSEFTGVLTLKGLHMTTGATGDYAVLTITFPRLQFSDVEDIGGKNSLIDQGISFDVLKADTPALDMTIVATEV